MPARKQGETRKDEARMAVAMKFIESYHYASNTANVRSWKMWYSKW